MENVPLSGIPTEVVRRWKMLGEPACRQGRNSKSEIYIVLCRNVEVNNYCRVEFRDPYFIKINFLVCVKFPDFIV